jgi:thioredoxin-like negative regulator of GroEL
MYRCGHCKNFAPGFEQTARNLQAKINVGKVDCTVETVTCSKYKIRGYPTLKFVQGDSAIDYRGQRSAEAVTSFGLSFLKYLSISRISLQW